MSTGEQPRARTRRSITISLRGLALFLLVLVVIVGAAGGALWFLEGSKDSPMGGPTGSALTAKGTGPELEFTYPKNWVRVSPSSIRGVSPQATAAVERTDKAGLFVVIPSGPAPRFDSAFAQKTSAQLDRKYDDYRFVSAKIVSLRPGKAFILSYIREKQNVLHTLTIIRAKNKSFVVETASPPSSKAIGAEIGRILHSATLVG